MGNKAAKVASGVQERTLPQQLLIAVSSITIKVDLPLFPNSSKRKKGKKDNCRAIILSANVAHVRNQYLTYYVNLEGLVGPVGLHDA
jgi:hypothetical protein